MTKKKDEKALPPSETAAPVIKPTKKAAKKQPAKKRSAKVSADRTLVLTPPQDDKNTYSDISIATHTPSLMSEEDRDQLTQSHQRNHPADTKLEFGDEMRKIILTGGGLELTDAQNKALYADFGDSDVSMKPDGLIYLPWIKYSHRLTETFGGTGWVLIPEGMPKELNSVVYWGFHLVIKQVYCGFAIGEQQYFNNNRMTYGEACEGAKSNALTRLCKGLGIGIKLWDKNFIEGWLSKYAVFKWEEGQNGAKSKKVYKLKSDTGFAQSSENTSNNPQNTNTGHNTTQTKRPTPHQKKEDVTALSVVENFRKKLTECTTMEQLGVEYSEVKKAWNNGQGTLTKPEIDTLRVLANDIAIKLGFEG